MKIFRIISFILILFEMCCSAESQPAHYTMAAAHSHNDYEQSLPFYDAYTRHFGSIEADVWAIHDTLFVAHQRDQVSADRTFSSLYLTPLIHQLKMNNGRAYKDGQQLQLLIDLKSSYEKVMPLLKKKLEPYLQYFGHAEDKPVRIVISGSMPPPDSLHYFNSIFTFDGRLGNRYSKADMQRIKLVSADIQKLVSWHVNAPMNHDQFHILKQVVDRVHQQHKLIRFWATPNTVHAYQILMKLGVDYIGTDDLFRLEWLIRNENTADKQ